MKTLNFNVQLDFSKDVKDDVEKTKSEDVLIYEIAINILEAIHSYADTHGIAPEDSNAYTVKIVVSNDIAKIKTERIL